MKDPISKESREAEISSNHYCQIILNEYLADYDEPLLTDRDQPPIEIPYLTSIEHAIWDNMTRVRDYWM